MAENTSVPTAKVAKVAKVAKATPKPKAAAKQAPVKATAKKVAAKKIVAKKTPIKKTGAKGKKAAAKKPVDLRTIALDTGRNAFLAGLGVYGKAYDQMADQLDGIQKQVEDAQSRLEVRRKQAESIYDSLVKRGEAVEKEARKAIDDMELDAITDRIKLEEQMSKAKKRFEELRSKLVNAV